MHQLSSNPVLSPANLIFFLMCSNKLALWCWSRLGLTYNTYLIIMYQTFLCFLSTLQTERRRVLHLTCLKINGKLCDLTNGFKYILSKTLKNLLATSKLPFTLAPWGCFGGREQRNRPPNSPMMQCNVAIPKLLVTITINFQWSKCKFYQP